MKEEDGKRFNIIEYLKDKDIRKQIKKRLEEKKESC